jgi:cell division protein FtsB
MRRYRGDPKLAKEGVMQGIALACLVLLAAIAIAGPSGLLAWGENQRMLGERLAEVERLKVERDVVRNRNALLDPRRTDADLAGELLRSNLNVVHPDEMVMLLSGK